MTSRYLLSGGGSAELERLTLQARVWEPEAQSLLNAVGVPAGGSTIDLGCGAMGILGPLSRCVGPTGRVVGIEIDQQLLTAAREYVAIQQLSNVTLLAQNAYGTDLPRASFDVTHERFLLASAGRDHTILAEMLALTKPGGCIVLEEPDAGSWNIFPEHAAWNTLKGAILRAFMQGGGDFNAGQRLLGMLQQAGVQDVELRTAVLPLRAAHPYLRLPIQFATTLRARILAEGILSATDLDDVLASCERLASDPRHWGMSFTLVQAWGRKPTTG